MTDATFSQRGSTPMPPGHSPGGTGRPASATAPPLLLASTPVRPDHAVGETVAVLALHGMGQQGRFDTIDVVARALGRRAEDAGHEVSPVTTRLVQCGDDLLGRAELVVGGTGQSAVHVHVYEAYWAPLTEGQVRLRDVLGFLTRAGWNGLTHSLLRGHFARFMFQRWIRFPVEPVAWLQFFAGLAFAAALAVMNVAVAVLVITAGLTLGRSRPAWFSDQLVSAWTYDLGAFGVCALLLGLVLGVSWRRHAAGPDRETPRGPANRAVTALAWTLAWMTVAVGIAAAVLLGWHFVCALAAPERAAGSAAGAALPHPCAACEWVRTPPLVPWALPLIVTAWVAALGATWVVRWMLVRFVGDVAAYVSSNTVSRFFDLRRRIQDTCLAVARAVYAAGYARVIPVGHSLGSVVAYDVLNRLINDDLAAPPGLDVVRRTPLFVTLGSPLDKTAFVFRTQRAEHAHVREALAAAVQPLILNYRHRPEKWINIWSRRDWISGSLEYYDDPEQIQGWHIQNIEDRGASIPLLAHLEYWSTGVCADAVLKAVLGRNARHPGDDPG